MQQNDSAPRGEALVTAVRRVAIIAAGSALLSAGLLMLVLPGPGILIILLGLAVLAREFSWARRVLQRAKAAGQSGFGSLRTLIGLRTRSPEGHV